MTSLLRILFLLRKIPRKPPQLRSTKETMVWPKWNCARLDRGAAMKMSLDAGQPVLVEKYPSLADSLGGGIGPDNRWTYSMCKELLDEVIILSESEIAVGMRHAYFYEREILEGAGAVGIAALLANKIPKLAGPVVLVLSGQNIDMDLHRRVMSKESDYSTRMEA